MIRLRLLAFVVVFFVAASTYAQATATPTPCTYGITPSPGPVALVGGSWGSDITVHLSVLNGGACSNAGKEIHMGFANNEDGYMPNECTTDANGDCPSFRAQGADYTFPMTINYEYGGASAQSVLEGPAMDCVTPTSAPATATPTVSFPTPNPNAECDFDFGCYFGVGDQDLPITTCMEPNLVMVKDMGGKEAGPMLFAWRQGDTEHNNPTFQAPYQSALNVAGFQPQFNFSTDEFYTNSLPPAPTPSGPCTSTGYGFCTGTSQGLGPDSRLPIYIKNDYCGLPSTAAGCNNPKGFIVHGDYLTGVATPTPPGTTADNPLYKLHERVNKKGQQYCWMAFRSWCGGRDTPTDTKCEDMGYWLELGIMNNAIQQGNGIPIVPTKGRPQEPVVVDAVSQNAPILSGLYEYSGNGSGYSTDNQSVIGAMLVKPFLDNGDRTANVSECAGGACPTAKWQIKNGSIDNWPLLDAIASRAFVYGAFDPTETPVPTYTPRPASGVPQLQTFTPTVTPTPTGCPYTPIPGDTGRCKTYNRAAYPGSGAVAWSTIYDLYTADSRRSIVLDWDSPTFALWDANKLRYNGNTPITGSDVTVKNFLTVSFMTTALGTRNQNGFTVGSYTGTGVGPWRNITVDCNNREPRWVYLWGSDTGARIRIPGGSTQRRSLPVGSGVANHDIVALGFSGFNTDIPNVFTVNASANRRGADYSYIALCNNKEVVPPTATRTPKATYTNTPVPPTNTPTNTPTPTPTPTNLPMNYCCQNPGACAGTGTSTTACWTGTPVVNAVCVTNACATYTPTFTPLPLQMRGYFLGLRRAAGVLSELSPVDIYNPR